MVVGAWHRRFTLSSASAFPTIPHAIVWGRSALASNTQHPMRSIFCMSPGDLTGAGKGCTAGGGREGAACSDPRVACHGPVAERWSPGAERDIIFPARRTVTSGGGTCLTKGRGVASLVTLPRVTGDSSARAGRGQPTRIYTRHPDRVWRWMDGSCQSHDVTSFADFLVAGVGKPATVVRTRDGRGTIG